MSEVNSSKSPLARGVDAERTGCVKMGVVDIDVGGQRSDVGGQMFFAGYGFQVSI